MWRNLTRGIQQGLKRGFGKEPTDACGTSIKDEGSKSYKNCHFTNLLPCAYQHFNRRLSHEDQNEYRREYKKTSRHVCQHSILEVFGWSGALVFGWTISKQLWLRQTFGREQDTSTNCKNIVRDDSTSFIKILAQVVKTQPPVAFVLPNVKPQQVEKSTKDDADEDNNSECSKEDDEFDAAGEELNKVHANIIGEALNRKGIAYLSKAINSEAMKYFQKASEFKYPPASFNMGQCCELGIGTKQDFKQAADWYKIAAEQGHATAMYNLGVFYAHGWGGLQADINSAKKLFVQAAKLGQPDAVAALEKETKLHTSFNNSKNSQIPQGKGTEPIYISEFSFIRPVEDKLILKKAYADEKKWDLAFNVNGTVAF